MIYLGCSPIERHGKHLSLGMSNYVLFVGNRGAYKNFNWMFNAISDFLKEKNMNLICAGGGVFSEDEIKMFTSVNLYSKVHFIDISNDDILNNLYANAFCFVFPSLYEGFGIPILESFTNSCPVVLSKASCFPEIAGSAVLYFELDKVESLVEQLNVLYYDKDLRNYLIKNSNEVLKKYSWTKMVDEHMLVYNSILDR